MGMASQIAEREDNVVVEDLRGARTVLGSLYFSPLTILENDKKR